jgi:hypothetical protein
MGCGEFECGMLKRVLCMNMAIEYRQRVVDWLHQDRRVNSNGAGYLGGRCNFRHGTQFVFVDFDHLPRQPQV